MANFLNPLGPLFTHQTLSSTACMAVSIWQSPNPPFSLPHCLNSSPTGLLAFPQEQSTGPVSKHFCPSVSKSFDKNSSPYSLRPPQFSSRPHNTLVLSDSHPTLKTIFGHFVQSLGLFIYRPSCSLWFLFSLFGVNLHLFSHKWQICGQAVKMQREKGSIRGA